MNRLICALALVLTVGCTKAIFRPYVGSQQSWPTAEGSIVNTRFKLPIFTNLPPSPYEVLGEIRIESPDEAASANGNKGFLLRGGQWTNKPAM